MGQYDHTHKGRQVVAAELCKLANHRAGYEHGLRLSLEAQNIPSKRIDYLIQRARARDFEAFKTELSHYSRVK